MAIYRDTSGNIDKQEFENHLKAYNRKEGYIEIIMYTPDTSVRIAEVSSEDKLDICDITSVTDIEKYTSHTIATLEENLWLLNGRFIVYQGGSIDGYISESVSDSDGNFATAPTMTVQLSNSTNIEDFSIILNSAVPTGYPKNITISCYDTDNNLLNTCVKDIEWQEATKETDEEGNIIYKKVLLDSLPSVNFQINQSDVDHLVITYGSTRFRNRRIRVSSILFGKTLVLDQKDIISANYTDKTSYVCDTLPSRVFSFDVNNYDSIYNIDNPDNGYIKLNTQTRVRFRNGYNVCGYQYDDEGYVIMEDGVPVVDMTQDGVEIEWDDWRELRLTEVSANADESATFTASSLLDIMDDTYTKELYTGDERTVQEIVEDILTFEGLDLNSVEWSSDGIKTPTTDENGLLLPYESWKDTLYSAYTINTFIPEVSCKQVLQLIAFSIGATILIKNNGHIKFANLNLQNESSFTNSYQWDYKDFVSIPAAEQLETVSKLTDISLPKYYSYLDYSGKEEITALDGNVYSQCTVISTINCTAINTEVTYSECLPIGCRLANDDESGATITNTELYCKRGIVELGGYIANTEAKVEILGYPITTVRSQERNVTNDSLVLDTEIMNYDISSYNSTGTINENDQIKRKYLEWYKKKFKYTFSTRGEPLVNAR